MHSAGAATEPGTAGYVIVNTHVHVPPNFSAFETPESAVAAAREVYALVDHTKFGRTASATFCRTDRLTGILTDEKAPADMVAALREMGVQVVLVPASAER
jgi:DeoR/GlpR family transcriptional regulator of sugar metabolism